MKKYLLYALCIICAACTKNVEPWNNNQGQDPNQEENTPEETYPSYANVNIDDEATSEDNITNTTFDGIISITYKNTGATVSGKIEGVEITTDGARVKATNSGDKKVKYILSGSSNDGSFTLYSSKKQAIELNGLTLTNTKGAAINNQSKKRTFILISGANTISDGNVNNSGNYPEETADEDMKAAVFSEGQLIFSGSGTLKVNAIGKAGITSDDYVRFLTGSNVTVSSSKGHGVRGKDAIVVSGGNVNVTLESTATGKKCFTSDSLVFIGGGNITLTNKASAGKIDSELTGAAGIKADKLFVIRGGALSVTTSGKGCKCINGDADGYFEGGTVTAKATGANYGSSGRYNDSSNSVTAKAIKFDGKIEISGSEVSVSASSHEAIESKSTIFISGGRISATSNDDAINSASTMTISDGVIYAYSTGNDGLDANGNLIIQGGNVFAIGCGNPEVAIDANTESRYNFYLLGGNVIAIGGIEKGSTVNQPIISTSWNKNTRYSLCDGDKVLFTFKTPASGGTGLYLSSPSLVSGETYSLKTSAEVSGGESYFNGLLSVGGSASGGSSSTVTAQTYTSEGGNTQGGGGQGGPGGPGGWGW